MPWPNPKFVVYDFDNELILFFNETKDELTDEDLRNNKILLTWEKAKVIRHAKGLPMPSPPPPKVEVVE